MGATRMNVFLRQADGYGQADGDHPSPWTDPDDTERLTGIYGSVRRLGFESLRARHKTPHAP